MWVLSGATHLDMDVLFSTCQWAGSALVLRASSVLGLAQSIALGSGGTWQGSARGAGSRELGCILVLCFIGLVMWAEIEVHAVG